MSTIKTDITQAERWLQAWRDAFPPFALDQSQATIQKTLLRLQARYEHIVIGLTDQGRHVGNRRIFRDRSYCDMVYQGGLPTMICGTMSVGTMGDAHNGKSIELENPTLTTRH